MYYKTNPKLFIKSILLASSLIILNIFIANPYKIDSIKILNDKKNNNQYYLGGINNGCELQDNASREMSLGTDLILCHLAYKQGVDIPILDEKFNKLKDNLICSPTKVLRKFEFSFIPTDYSRLSNDLHTIYNIFLIHMNRFHYEMKQILTKNPVSVSQLSEVIEFTFSAIYPAGNIIERFLTPGPWLEPNCELSKKRNIADDLLLPTDIQIPTDTYSSKNCPSEWQNYQKEMYSYFCLYFYTVENFIYNIRQLFTPKDFNRWPKKGRGSCFLYLFE